MPSLSRPQPEPAHTALRCAHAQGEPSPNAHTEARRAAVRVRASLAAGARRLPVRGRRGRRSARARPRQVCARERARATALPHRQAAGPGAPPARPAPPRRLAGPAPGRTRRPRDPAAARPRLPCCAGPVWGARGSGFSRFRLGRSRRHTMKSAPPIINSHHDRDVSADSGQWEREISAGRDSARPRPPVRGGAAALSPSAPRARRYPRPGRQRWAPGSARWRGSER